MDRGWVKLGVTRDFSQAEEGRDQKCGFKLEKNRLNVVRGWVISQFNSK